VWAASVWFHYDDGSEPADVFEMNPPPLRVLLLIRTLSNSPHGPEHIRPLVIVRRVASLPHA